MKQGMFVYAAVGIAAYSASKAYEYWCHKKVREAWEKNQRTLKDERMREERENQRMVFAELRQKDDLKYAGHPRPLLRGAESVQRYVLDLIQEERNFGRSTRFEAAWYARCRRPTGVA